MNLARNYGESRELAKTQGDSIESPAIGLQRTRRGTHRPTAPCCKLVQKLLC